MIAIYAVNSLVVMVVVIIHYEFLFKLTIIMPKIRVKHRLRILFGVFGALIAHAVEVWIFALAYYVMHHYDGWGTLSGAFTGTLLDCCYFSFSSTLAKSARNNDCMDFLELLLGIFRCEST